MKKRIVYLDQFALSQMMKVLDPDRNGQKRAAVDPFYRKLFEQLDRLGKLMLMVCPYSPIHQIESMGLAKLASPDASQTATDAEEGVFREQFEKVRQLFVHLSFGTKFYTKETIRDRQVITALEEWIQRGDRCRR